MTEPSTGKRNATSFPVLLARMSFSKSGIAIILLGYSPSAYQSLPNDIAVNSTGGLQLTFSLNNTAISTGQGIVIQAQEHNALDRVDNVTASNDWASGNLGEGFGPCTFDNSPLRFSVFDGYYTRANFSKAAALEMVNPAAIYLCPAIFAVHTYAFQPASDVALVTQC